MKGPDSIADVPIGATLYLVSEADSYEDRDPILVALKPGEWKPWGSREILTAKPLAARGYGRRFGIGGFSLTASAAWRRYRINVETRLSGLEATVARLRRYAKHAAAEEESS